MGHGVLFKCAGMYGVYAYRLCVYFNYGSHLVNALQYPESSLCGNDFASL